MENWCNDSDRVKPKGWGRVEIPVPFPFCPP
jgi:hypothetical protein